MICICLCYFSVPNWRINVHSFLVNVGLASDIGIKPGGSGDYSRSFRGNGWTLVVLNWDLRNQTAWNTPAGNLKSLLPSSSISYVSPSGTNHISAECFYRLRNVQPIGMEHWLYCLNYWKTHAVNVISQIRQMINNWQNPYHTLVFNICCLAELWTVSSHWLNLEQTTTSHWLQLITKHTVLPFKSANKPQNRKTNRKF